jgi:hypothetical protein
VVAHFFFKSVMPEAVNDTSVLLVPKIVKHLDTPVFRQTELLILGYMKYNSSVYLLIFYSVFQLPAGFCGQLFLFNASPARYHFCKVCSYKLVFVTLKFFTKVKHVLHKKLQQT